MLSRKKNNSIFSMLHNREINDNASNFFSSKIVRQLLRTNENLYKEKKTIVEQGDASYENGMIFFANYKKFTPVNTFKKLNIESPPFFPVENIDVEDRFDVIAFSGKYQNMEKECTICESNRCVCLSASLISVSENGWLSQHLIKNGRLLKKIFLNMDEEPRERIILNRLNRSENYGRFSLTCDYFDIFDDEPHFDLQLFVFKFPCEFFTRIKMKNTVFGKTVKDVHLFNEFLIIEYQKEYHFYEFDDFIKQGMLTPFKVGDDYENLGKIGSHPVGLPCNFTYDKASPMLFRIEAITMAFGSKAWRYGLMLFPEAQHATSNVMNFIQNICSRFTSYLRITAAEANKPVELDEFVKKYCDGQLIFHPDQPRSLLAETEHSIDFFKISSQKDNMWVSKQFSLHLTEDTVVLRNWQISRSPLIIQNFDYNQELDIFAIFGKREKDNYGFVKLYENGTGEHLKTIEITELQTGYNVYYLHVDSCAIIIIENLHIVHVYMM